MSGGGKETPRQKMIGMMYLVLTAMLALNVSAEVLNAFGLFEQGLSQTAKVFGEKNDATESAFRVANAENKDRVGPWLEKAVAVRSASKELTEFVEELKVELVKMADGPESPALEEERVRGDLIINQSTTDPSSRLMVNMKKGVELKDKIVAYRDLMLSMVNPSARGVISNIEKTLSTPKIKATHGSGMKLWEVGTFADLPVIAAVPLLTKIQVDVLTIEADMMTYLLMQADVGTVKIDNFDPVVQSVSDYVIRGGEFEAKIFLAASDRSLQPNIVVNGQTLKTVDGKAQYKTSANNVGEQTLKGTITLNGKPYPFIYNYMVAEPNVVVSPSKMNVLYRGVDNPIDVSAAGIPDNKVQVSVTNGRLNKVGAQYMVTPEDGNTCDVNIIAEINGVRTNMGKRTFRVKNVPVPAPEMDGVKGKTATKQQLDASQGVRAIMPQDFDFDLRFTVKSFTVFASIDGYVREEASTSMMFTEKQKQIMRKVGSGQRLSITDIKAVGPDGRIVDMPDLSVKIR